MLQFYHRFIPRLQFLLQPLHTCKQKGLGPAGVAEVSDTLRFRAAVKCLLTHALSDVAALTRPKRAWTCNLSRCHIWGRT